MSQRNQVGWQDKARIAEWLKTNAASLQGTLRVHRAARVLEELGVTITIGNLMGIEHACGLVFNERKPKEARKPRKSRALAARVAALEKALVLLCQRWQEPIPPCLEKAQSQQALDLN